MLADGSFFCFVLFMGRGAGFSCLRAQSDNNKVSLLGSIINPSLESRVAAVRGAVRWKQTWYLQHTFVTQLCSLD